MPYRQKTTSWHCTVAGILSVNCPSLFKSGTETLGESGWWSLQSLTPPTLSDVIKAISSELYTCIGYSYFKHCGGPKLSLFV